MSAPPVLALALGAAVPDLAAPGASRVAAKLEHLAVVGALVDLDLEAPGAPAALAPGFGVEDRVDELGGALCGAQELPGGLGGSNVSLRRQTSPPGGLCQGQPCPCMFITAGPI